jgi:FkbM family methyltransferase
LIRSVLGLLRSLAIYWRPGRQAALRDWYREWVPADGLVFDVGAHLGDRSVAFSDLGARVIALEPQPALLPTLRFITRNHPRIEVVASAVGSAPGQATLRVSAATPTVSSLSMEWIRSVRGANPGFRRVRWESTVTVPITTLDSLIVRHGLPDFCKIDVEGFEAEVLLGVSQPLPAVSFEFIPGAMAITEACVQRLEFLAAYRYNAALAEQRHFVFRDWIGPDDVLRWLRGGGPGPRSGDVYARLDGRPRG